MCKKLEEIGEVLGEEEGDAGSDGRCSSSLLSSSSVAESRGGGGASIDSNSNNSNNMSVGSKRKGKSSPSAMAPIRKRAKKGSNGSASGGSSIRAGRVHVAKRLFEKVGLVDGDGFKCKDENRGHCTLRRHQRPVFHGRGCSYYNGGVVLQWIMRRRFHCSRDCGRDHIHMRNVCRRLLLFGNWRGKEFYQAIEWWTKAARRGIQMPWNSLGAVKPMMARA